MKLRFAARRVDIVSFPLVTLSEAKSARRGEHSSTAGTLRLVVVSKQIFFSGKNLLKIRKVYANPRGWQLKNLRTPSGKYLFFTKSTRVLRKIRNFFLMKNLAWSKQILRKINPKLMQITQIYAKNFCVRTPKYWVVNPLRLQTTLRFFGYFWPPLHLSWPVTFAFKVGFPCKLPIPGKGFKYSGKQNCHLYL